MINKETIKQLVNDKIAHSDYFLVDVTVSTSNHIVVEIDNQDGVNIDFCAELSRHISGDLLVIYIINDNTLQLLRIGTHSQLFK